MLRLFPRSEREDLSQAAAHPSRTPSESGRGSASCGRVLSWDSSSDSFMEHRAACHAPWDLLWPESGSSIAWDPVLTLFKPILVPYAFYKLEAQPGITGELHLDLQQRQLIHWQSRLSARRSTSHATSHKYKESPTNLPLPSCRKLSLFCTVFNLFISGWESAGARLFKKNAMKKSPNAMKKAAAYSHVPREAKAQVRLYTRCLWKQS